VLALALVQLILPCSFIPSQRFAEALVDMSGGREVDTTLTQARVEDLIQQVRQGKSAAAETLVDMYWDRVYTFAYRLSFNQADAEDIAQETFLRAFKNLDSYRPEGSFKSWLLRVATNIFLDQRKAARSRDVISADMSKYVEAAPSAEDRYDQQELLDALWQVVQTLSKEQQVVILLRAVEHLDYPEIAGILAVKESTARWHMYEARRILRQKLGTKFDLGGQGDES